MEAAIVVVLLIANIPVYRFIFRLIFKSSDDFKESVKYSFTPDIFSLFKGKYWKDQIGEAKLSFFIFACVIVIIAEFAVIQAIIRAITE